MREPQPGVIYLFDIANPAVVGTTLTGRTCVQAGVTVQPHRDRKLKLGDRPENSSNLCISAGAELLSAGICHAWRRAHLILLGNAVHTATCDISPGRGAGAEYFSTFVHRCAPSCYAIRSVKVLEIICRFR